MACSQYAFFFFPPPFFVCDQSSGVACSQYLHAASLERRGGALFAFPGVQEIEVSERVMARVENHCRQLKALRGWGGEREKERERNREREWRKEQATPEGQLKASHYSSLRPHTQVA